jgi:hypothetical protein
METKGQMMNKDDVLKKFDELGLQQYVSEVPRFLEYKELLLKYNLNGLIERLMAENKKQNFFDTLAECYRNTTRR